MEYIKIKINDINENIFEKYKMNSGIIDKKVFNENMSVLSYTLGNKFDRKFFIDILNN